MKQLTVFTLCLLLSSCGYHMMGKGNGVVPEDVQLVRIIGAGGHDRFLEKMQTYLLGNASYNVVSAADEVMADTEIHIGRLAESMSPISFDANGITTVERMTLSGDISLWRNNERIWTGGSVSVYEDVNVSSGPAAIESTKRRIRSDLESQWIRQAWLKLSSDF